MHQRGKCFKRTFRAALCFKAISRYLVGIRLSSSRYKTCVFTSVWICWCSYLEVNTTGGDYKKTGTHGVLKLWAFAHYYCFVLKLNSQAICASVLTFNWICCLQIRPEIPGSNNFGFDSDSGNVLFCNSNRSPVLRLPISRTHNDFSAYTLQV